MFTLDSHNDLIAGYVAAIQDAKAGKLPNSFTMKHASLRYRRGYAVGQQDYILGGRDLSA